MSLVQHLPHPLELDSPSSHKLYNLHSPTSSCSSYRPSASPPIIAITLSASPSKRSASAAASTSTSKSPAATPGGSSKPLPPSRTEKKFKCNYDGCDKAYTKPSRLTEHEITHTGERPYACTQCHKTFLRDSHLSNHMRTHLSEDAKTFLCPRPECDKKFWTAQHLKKHEEYHDRAVVYPCEQCDATFLKTHLLRDHITLTHMPEGARPWPCDHPGCELSFTLKGHLTRHKKTHDPNRYTCSHPSHGDEFPSFPAWSTLQTHMHQAHPPMCSRAECNGRAFKNAQRLKDHLKVHAERDADIAAKAEAAAQARDVDLKMLDPSTLPPIIVDGLGKRAKRRRSTLNTNADLDGGKSPKLPRVADGEAGKHYACDYEDCEKKFKTKFALNTHRNAVHLMIRNYSCPIEGCDKTYTLQASLNKHIAAHSRPPTPATPRREERGERSALTGIDKAEMRRFGCPSWAYIPESVDSSVSVGLGLGLGLDQHDYDGMDHEHQNPEEESVVVKQEPEFAIDPALLSSPPLANSNDYAKAQAEQVEQGQRDQCMIRFWRVYDVRRHLAADHGIELEDMQVRELLVVSGQTGERT